MKKLGRDPQTEQKILLQEKRSRLQSDLDDFGRQARVFLNSLAISHSPQTSNIEEWPDLEDLDVDSDLPQSSTTATDISQMDESLPPELRPLPLPSALLNGVLTNNGPFLEVAFCEFELREGQANDSLHDLRISIAYKSYLYRTTVRNNSPTQSYTTRSYGEIRTVQISIEQAAKTYRLARKAMSKLKPSDTLSVKYPALKKEDLRANTAVADSNAPGQRSDALSWIWNTSPSALQESDPASLNECISTKPLF